MSNKDENKVFLGMFYDLLDSYRILVKKEYQFVYDDFFEHIMSDTNIQTEKNFNPENKGDKIKYKMVIFKGCLYRHLASSKGEKLRHPEKFPELKRILRIRKLEKLEKNEKAS